MIDDLLQDLRRSLREAHRLNLGPKGWRLSEETKKQLLAGIGPWDSTLNMDPGGEVKLMGLPFLIDRDLAEPFRIETERRGDVLPIAGGRR